MTVAVAQGSNCSLRALYQGRCCLWCSDGSVRLLSAVLYVLLLVAYGLVQYWWHLFTRRHLGDWQMHTLLSLSFVLMDTACRLASQYLTYVERHRRWSDHRQWDCIKALALRMAMFMIFMWMQDFTYDSQIAACHRPPRQTCLSCQAEFRAQQMVIMLVVDLVLSNLWEIGLAHVYHCCCRALFGGVGSRRPDRSFRQPFDLGQEYTEVVFRQFMIGMTFGLVPLAPALGVLGGLVEIPVDKFRLLRLTQLPERRTRVTFARTVGVFMLLSACGVLVGYPTGVIFLLRNHLACDRPD